MPALEALRARGLRLVVVSNANGTLRAHLDRLDLTRRFDCVLDSADEGVEKPDPRFFEIALERERRAEGDDDPRRRPVSRRRDRRAERRPARRPARRGGSAARRGLPARAVAGRAGRENRGRRIRLDLPPEPVAPSGRRYRLPAVPPSAASVLLDPRPAVLQRDRAVEDRRARA